jgi:hypothetical protein
MKYIFILLSFLSFLFDASAQIPRKWTSLKGPNVGNLLNVMLGKKNEIICVATNGYYYTTNDGDTWAFQKIVEDDVCSGNGQDVQFRNSNLHILSNGDYYYILNYCSISEKEGLYKSTDFGTTWTHIAKISNIKDFIEGNGDTLFLSNSESNNLSSLWESIDKGKSWVKLADVDNSDNLGSLSLLDDGILYHQRNYIGKYSFIDHSTKTFMNGLNGNYGGIFYESNNLFLFPNFGQLYSTDGDSAWRPTGTIPKESIYIVQGSNGSLFSVNLTINRDSAYLSLTTDQGKTLGFIRTSAVPN